MVRQNSINDIILFFCNIHCFFLVCLQHFLMVLGMNENLTFTLKANELGVVIKCVFCYNCSETGNSGSGRLLLEVIVLQG